MKAPIPKHMQAELLDFAACAYAYMCELDHPLRDSVMVANTLDCLRQSRHDLPYAARQLITRSK